MTYIVQAANRSRLQLINQFDGSPDQNVTCGECDVAMIGQLYKADYYAPETIKTYLVGPQNVGTYDTQLEAALMHFYGITAHTVVPQGKRNGSTGLLDYEWQALDKGIPTIWAGYWIDAQKWIYDGKHSYTVNGQTITPPVVKHWRLVVEQTDTTVTCADSSGGVLLTRSWDEHYALSDGVLVVPNAPPQ